LSAERRPLSLTLSPVGRGKEFLAVGIVLIAIGLARFNPAPIAPPPPPPNRALFDQLVSDEPKDRESALDDWAHHRWSQQDAFGALERERATKFAREHELTTQDALLLIDEGLRQGWPGPNGVKLDVTTVPLKPRPND
jgi:hypothetical protein